MVFCQKSEPPVGLYEKPTCLYFFWLVCVPSGNWDKFFFMKKVLISCIFITAPLHLDEAVYLEIDYFMHN